MSEEKKTVAKKTTTKKTNPNLEYASESVADQPK